MDNMDELNGTGRDEKGRFAKGNLFSQGLSNSGRPPIYNNHELIAQRIADYLDFEDHQTSGAKPGTGKYSLEGCALFLGFASVQSMYDYEKRSPEFSYVINRYRLFLTKWNVDKLYWGGSSGGAQFWLKNKADYKDEVIQQQNQTITHVQPQVISSGVKRASNENDIDV